MFILPVWGVSNTSDGVGENNALELHLRRPARLNSRISAGSTQPGIMLIASVRLPSCFREVVDHGLGHAGEPGDVRPDIAGRVGMEDVLALGDFAVVLRLGDDLVDVVADGLGQAVVWTPMTAGL